MFQNDFLKYNHFFDKILILTANILNCVGKSITE